MRALSDKWNPRLWLRDWINKPSLAEFAERAAAEAAAAQMLAGLERRARSTAAAYQLQLDPEARVTGVARLSPQTELRP